MDFRDTPDEARFRAELRAWLEEHLPADLRGADPLVGDLDLPAHRAWSRSLHQGGWAGITWPREHGGRGLSGVHQAIAFDELSRAQAPAHVGVIGLGMAGPTIIAHGTPDQRSRLLAPILAAEELWCQGFSEPEAGSDLSALRTQAQPKGDVLVLRGEKLWSSYAQHADRCLLLARSDPSARGHDGLTMLLLDMRSPGVEVRPLRQLSGVGELCALHFDDVAVPLHDVVGMVGDGWRVAVTTLLHERGTLGAALVSQLAAQVDQLVALARDRGATALQRDRLARLWIDLQALRITAARSLAGLDGGGAPGPEGSILKLCWSEAHQRVTELASELIGPEAQLLPPNAPYGGRWQLHRLRSRANTIEAGTSEILRSIVAERVLGLPRSR